MFNNGKFSLLIVIFQISVCLQIVQIAHGAYESNYEPEKQTDGPPAPLAAPIYKWNGEDNHNEDSQQVAPAATRSIARRADLDPEEEFDEDDRDEDKSGSSQHGSFENPSFGESRRAAKDGEDIETFFDKHLGPPSDAVAGNSDESETSAPVVSERIDPDDGYETAASTPLTDIFHTLIKAHRRPFVITTTSSSDDAPTSGSENQQQQAQQSQQQQQQQQSASLPPAGQLMSPSASSMSPANTPQQMNPMMRGTPFMDPTPFPLMAAMSPMAYFNPIAAPSNLNPYEPPAMPDSSNNEEYPGGAGREIYIVRRPSVLQHIRAVAPPLQRLVQQSSNAHWRGVPFSAPHMAPRGPYPGAEESPAASAEYHNYPIGAHSYSYQREQPQRESSSDDEPGTVSFGLSFGGHSSLDGGAADEPENTSGAEEQSSVDEQPSSMPTPYHSGYSSSRNPVRYTSSTRAYNNYNYPPPQPIGGQGYPPSSGSAYAQAGSQGSPMNPQYQHHYHGARYHKDPSESAAQPINYAQYSPMHSGSNQGDYASWMTRQQLLANLDRQIKNNQYYRQQNTDPSSSTQYPQSAPAITVRRRFKTRLSKDDNDVDTYNSYHSEVDPYKSFTASSKLVNEPRPEDTLQKGSHHEPPNAEMSQRITENGRNLDGTSSATNNLAENSQLKTTNQNSLMMAEPGTRTLNNFKQQDIGVSGDLLRNKAEDGSQHNHRVRREDADDRESDDADDAGDDGVWVDDDDDDDNRQTASDLNETTQDPEQDEENQQEETRPAHHVPGVIGNPHGYDLV